MILRTAYVRFYRAFNFDYLRKTHPNARPDPWDRMPDGTFYPCVRLDIDPELTAVVGANESGKSQILEAIECCLSARPSTPADFCRYSDYFTVTEAMRTPHFGLHFECLTPEQTGKLSGLLGQDLGNLSSFRVFWTRPGVAEVYIDNEKHEVTDLLGFRSILPKVFSIDPSRALPNSVPISYVVAGGQQAGADPGPPRPDRWRFVDSIVNNGTLLLQQRGDPAGFGQVVQSILDEVSGLGTMSERETGSFSNQLALAYDLLVTVGGIHLSVFEELQEAVRNDDEGLANGIVARMNTQLERSLNLARWWSQDSLFRLAITVRDFDIVFTVRDRTGSEYSFAERSGGLKYFLSYLVQFLAHIEDRIGPEILLMDEPDAYLSNQGQQDLLRVFHEFTRPTNRAPGGQVVYVTHSPFLIDKNRADRLRVLDKGSGEEGVRVVRDVGRNHFEPLRTALGGFVGETAFIGNCNLIVEGLTDQVYLAGMSELLNRSGVAATQRLDLNRITLVPAGSASHVAYMTFLARGRDANKPAVIVLLDGDGEGDQAVKGLNRGGPRLRQIIRPEYVLQLKPDAIDGVTSDSTHGPLDIEDLISVDIALQAAKEYLKELGLEEPADFPSTEDVKQLLSASTGVFKATQAALDQAGSELRLDKLGFARNVMAVCSKLDPTETQLVRNRFKALFSQLTSMQRRAERERERESISARVEREKARFVTDGLDTATKADVGVFLERIETLIDPSAEGDALVGEVGQLRRDLDLSRNQHERIENTVDLKQRIEKLKYAELLASQPVETA